MSRNSTGTYSQATANFVNGTIVDAAPHNSRWTDMGTEMTDSLSRSGKGGMLAPLRIVDGSQAAPAYAFTSEVGTGFYRAGAADIRFASGGADWLTLASTITSHRPLTIAGALTAQAGATITQSTSNTAGLTVTGNGTAAGGVFTGGSSAGNGLTVTGGAGNGVGAVITGGSTGRGLTVSAGGGNNTGITSTGAGNAAGGSFTGGATGDGLRAVGGGGSASGIYATGGTNGVGAYFEPGTAATATTPAYSTTLNNGYLNFTNAATPNSNVAISNAVTASNIIKAVVRFTTNGSGGITQVNGFNVTGVAIVATTAQITFATPFTSGTAYGIVSACSAGASGGTNYTTTTVDVTGVNFSATVTDTTVWALGPQ